MRKRKSRIRLSFWIGVMLIFLMPTLIAGYGYEVMFNVKYTIFETIFIWFLVFGGLYIALNIVLLFLKSTWGKVHLVKELVDQLKIKGNEKILDVGCGLGVFSIEAAFHITTGSVVGVDFVESEREELELADAKQRADDLGVGDIVTFVRAPGTTIPLEENSFDIVASVTSLQKISSRQERETVLREIVRLAKPGGRILLVDVQLAKECASFLFQEGLRHVKMSKRRWLMIPPVHIVTAIKPAKKLEKDRKEEG